MMNLIAGKSGYLLENLNPTWSPWKRDVGTSAFFQCVDSRIRGFLG